MAEEKTFHLGLTMAGAVSAGAYTGGVMDYLFEVFDKWEKAKKGELDGVDSELVPKHNVKIEVIGGTSAGGMTTIMSALYAIKGQINPVTDDQAGTTGGVRDNIFYDTWVLLGDDKEMKTLEKALDTEDLKDNVLRSVLNSAFIDEIAKTAFKIPGNPGDNPAAKLPSYISKDLEITTSHSMLRGVPLEVVFGNPNGTDQKDLPRHATYEHFLLSHFKLNNGNPVNEDRYLWLNPFDEASATYLMEAAKATGAFPIGLIYRLFQDSPYNSEYVKTVLSRVIANELWNEKPDIRDRIYWDNFPESYESLTVDGGAINNEPYGEIESIVKARANNGLDKKDWTEKDENGYAKYGLIMIDPFPDRPELKDKYERPENLLEAVPQIISTLWEQSKVKRKEVNDESVDHLRGVIFPVKYKPKGGAYDYPIACSTLGAFGGFLDISFRHHDFYLGRNNARNYLRAYFSFPYDFDSKKGHPIHEDWTDEMREKFKITMKDGSTHLPVIPDMNFLLADGKDERFTYSIPEMPQYDPLTLNGLSEAIRNRVERVILVLKHMAENPKKKPQPVPTPTTDYWMNRWFRKNWWQRIKGWFAGKFAGVVVFFAKKTVYNEITEKIVHTILQDVEKKGFLKPRN
ncbi:MAG: patatin-like phospholipase family protein [Balneola sp.]